MAEPGKEGNTQVVVGGKVKKPLGLKKNRTLQIIIFVAVVTLAAGGFFAYKYFNKTEERVGDILSLDPTTEEGNKKLLEQSKKADVSGSADTIKVEHYRNLALLYIDGGDYNNALEALKQAEAISPNEPAILETIAIVYTNLGDIEKSNEYYKKAIAEYKKLKPAPAGVKQKIEELTKIVEL